jgi:hypothetical protein
VKIRVFTYQLECFGGAAFRAAVRVVFLRQTAVGFGDLLGSRGLVYFEDHVVVFCGRRRCHFLWISGSLFAPRILLEGCGQVREVGDPVITIVRCFGPLVGRSLASYLLTRVSCAPLNHERLRAIPITYDLPSLLHSLQSYLVMRTTVMHMFGAIQQNQSVCEYLFTYGNGKLKAERDRSRLDKYIALGRVREPRDRDSVSIVALCGLLDMSVPMLGLAFHNNRNAEYARPHQLELVLSAVEAVTQPNAPNNIAVL